MRAIGSASALAQPTSDTLVFVPTYNEARTIGPLIDEILRLPVAADVLVVDDRSSDNTRTEVQARAAASQRVKLVGRPCKLGIGSAHRLGWLYARRSGYARIVTLDGDFSHDPADIPRLLRAIDNGADFVIGSRFAPGGRLDYRGIRRIVSRSANILARYLLRLRLTEHTTALRAARLDRIPLGLIETINHEGYSFFLTSVRQVVCAGFNVIEVPIHFSDRQHGKSKLPPTEIFYGLVTLLRLAGLGRRAEYFPPLVDAESACPSCNLSYRVPSSFGPRCLVCSGPHRVRGGAVIREETVLRGGA